MKRAVGAPDSSPSTADAATATPHSAKGVFYTSLGQRPKTESATHQTEKKAYLHTGPKFGNGSKQAIRVNEISGRVH